MVLGVVLGVVIGCSMVCMDRLGDAMPCRLDEERYFEFALSSQMGMITN